MDSKKLEIEPLLVIVGETASGKSGLAMAIAEEFNGEIVNADSRAFYKGMDIGTAKPSKFDQKKIPHHLIDITTPDSPLNASEYKKLALKAINDIISRQKLPILVGGSGLYIDSVLFDFSFNKKPDFVTRALLNELSVSELQKNIEAKKLSMPINKNNKRHLVRVLEHESVSATDNVLRPNTLILGIKIDPEIRRKKIETRVEQMFRSGLENEVRTLFVLYGWGAEPMRTIGYQEFKNYFSGDETLDEVRMKIINATNQYAKRQRTWFKRNKYIQWVDQQREIVDLVTTLLNK